MLLLVVVPFRAAVVVVVVVVVFAVFGASTTAFLRLDVVDVVSSCFFAEDVLVVVTAAVNAPVRYILPVRHQT